MCLGVDGATWAPYYVHVYEVADYGSLDLQHIMWLWPLPTY